MAYHNGNFDFVIPQNGSLYVEIVDNIDQYRHALANPVPTGVIDHGYQMFGGQQPYGQPQMPSGFQLPYGNMQGPYGMQQPYGYPQLGYDAEQPFSNSQSSYGMMRFGPSYTIIGPHPPQIEPGTGFYDPTLVVPGAPRLNIGVY